MPATLEQLQAELKRRVDAKDPEMLAKLQGIRDRPAVPPAVPSSRFVDPQAYSEQRQIAAPEISRKQALYDELKNRGFSSDQILAGVRAIEIAGRGNIGSDIGATVLGIGAPLAAGLALGPGGGLLTKAALGLTSLAGSNVGGVVGELAEQKIRGEPRDIGAAFKEGNRQTLWQAGGMAGGSIAGRGLNKIKLAFDMKHLANSPETAELMEDFANTVGGFLTPAQRSQGTLTKTAEAMARGSFGGQAVFDKHGLMMGQKATEFADALLNRMAAGMERLSPEELGNQIAAMVEKPEGTKWKMLDDLVGPIYDKIQTETMGGKKAILGERFKTVPTPFGPMTIPQGRGVTGHYIEGPMVNTNPLREWAADLLQRNRDPKRVPFLTSVGEKRLTDIVNLNQQTSFGDMITFRRRLIADERAQAAKVSQSHDLTKQAIGRTTDVMNDPQVEKWLALWQQLNPDPKTPNYHLLWKNTNTIYRTASEQWDKVIPKRVAQMLENHPESVEKLFTPGAPERNLALREFFQKGLAGEDEIGKQRWSQLTTGLVSSWVTKATNPETGIISPRIFGRCMSDMGDDSLKVILTPSQENSANKVMAVLEAIQKQGTGSTGLFIKGTQVMGAKRAIGAAGGLGIYAAGPAEASIKRGVGGLTIALTPYAFAKLATTPTGSDILTWLLTRPTKMKGASEVGVIAGRIVRELTNQKATEKQKAQQAEREEFNRTHPSLGSQLRYR